MNVKQIVCRAYRADEYTPTHYDPRYDDRYKKGHTPYIEKLKALIASGKVRVRHKRDFRGKLNPNYKNAALVMLVRQLASIGFGCASIGEMVWRDNGYVSKIIRREIWDV